MTVNAAPVTSRPLGRILVERRLISAEQLDDLLAEQTASRRRLGSIAVSRGIIPASELTSALREQLFEQIGSYPLPARFPRLDESTMTRTLVERIRSVVSRSPAQTPSAEKSEPMGEMIVRSRAGDGETFDRLEPATTPQTATTWTAGADLTELRSELHQTQMEVAAQRDRIAELTRRTSEIGESLRMTENRPRAASVEHDESSASEDDTALLQPARPEESVTVLLFLPRQTGGYELVERSGCSPAVGETIEIDDRRFTVSRVGRAPLPAGAPVCAYLHADA